MSANKPIVPFGNWFDNVRVRATPVTEAIGLAGRTGQVYGETVPSSSGVGRDEIVGELAEDYAVNVHFDDIDKDVWFTRDMLEFVDHAPGTQITIGGKTRIRSATGEWMETSVTPTSETSSNSETANRKIKLVVGIAAAVIIIIVLASTLNLL